MICCEPGLSSKSSFLISCEMHSNSQYDAIEQSLEHQFKALHPQLFYKARDHDKNSWVVEVALKTRENKLKVEYAQDLSHSIFIKGDDVFSFCHLLNSKLLVPLIMTNICLVIQDWEITQEVNLTCDYIRPHLLLPGFDVDSFPFVIMYAKDDFELMNLRTGQTDSLVSASAGNEYEWPATFFTAHTNDCVDFFFCTARLNDESMYEHACHVMEFNADFVQMLKKY